MFESNMSVKEASKILEVGIKYYKRDLTCDVINNNYCASSFAMGKIK